MNAHTNGPIPHETATFGGLQFTYELEGCFVSQSAILAEMLDSQVKHLPHPVGLILGNVHRNAMAVRSLASDELVNECYLIMRLLVDSSISAAYLLAADEEERRSYLRTNSQSTTFLSSAVPEDIIEQAKELTHVDQIPPHSLKRLRDRIDFICEKTGRNKDSWLTLVASIFPHSGEILAGTPRAYTFSFLGESHAPAGQRDEFAMLFFMGSEVLH